LREGFSSVHDHSCKPLFIFGTCPPYSPPPLLMSSQILSLPANLLLSLELVRHTRLLLASSLVMPSQILSPLPVSPPFGWRASPLLVSRPSSLTFRFHDSPARRRGGRARRRGATSSFLLVPPHLGHLFFSASHLVHLDQPPHGMIGGDDRWIRGPGYSAYPRAVCTDVLAHVWRGKMTVEIASLAHAPLAALGSRAGARDAGIYTCRHHGTCR